MEVLPELRVADVTTRILVLRLLVKLCAEGHVAAVESWLVDIDELTVNAAEQEFELYEMLNEYFHDAEILLTEQ